MSEHIYRHRVRYRECDPMGLVYHAHYVDYFEYARTEALREMGVVYKELEASGVIMPVVDLSVRYHRPAYYDDVLEVKTIARDVPSTRVRLDYEIRREGSPDLLVSGQVTLCFVDAARNRPVRAPESVAAVFARAIEGA